METVGSFEAKTFLPATRPGCPGRRDRQHLRSHPRTASTLPLAWLRSLVHAATGGSWHAAGRSWASKKAPAAAVQTGYDGGASGPSAVVMATAKVRSRTPLASAARRTRTPARSATPSTNSATVAAQPATATSVVDRYGRIVAV